MSSSGSDFYWMMVRNDGWKKSGRTDFLDGKLTISTLIFFDSIYSVYKSNYHFFNNGEELMGHIDCKFDLYSINESEIVNKYKFFSVGYTCGTKVFARDSINYQLGGYGFWNSHIDLLSFDMLKGSWEFNQTAHQPIDYHSTNIYQNSKGIYSLFGTNQNIRKGINSKETQGYHLDLETKEWKPIEIIIDGINLSEFLLKPQYEFLETKDYYFLNFDPMQDIMGWNIIDKETGIIYFNAFTWADMFNSPYIEITNNKVSFLNRSGNLFTLDFDNLISQSREVGRINVLENQKPPLLSRKDVVYTTIITFLFTGILLLLIKKKKEEISPNGLGEIEKVLESLVSYSGEVLNSEKLDELLEINSLKNLDSRRLKRSRMINRINQHYQSKKGKELIFRVKTSEDNRYINYRIEL